ncbi:cell division protein FtsL [Tamilnaduibacter salinus]|uniref:Cell division protein FtsL n=1 Tax=Tamilnaduibacter salinus TaxID=1484056 RepID=A0A2A2I417_9GAMM|nr:cell division protein FtsL [Tamilnaduibacter salinus]PAV26046.1 cell division protein FtsL [Tamilnaduibacter salinus]PVY78819.1 cell division protein FtsL [Tamilnaduibacter salinus]
MSAVTIEKTAQGRTRPADQVRVGVSRALRLSKQVFRSLAQRQVLITAGLAICLLVSATAVVFSSHQNRVLFSELASLQEQRDAYQREWSQLLLEQSALSSHSRVERRAVDTLNMTVPDRDDVVLVPSH